MSNPQIFRLLLEAMAIIFVVYCVYRQDDIARWERKAWRFVKAFVKAVYFTVRDKVDTKHTSNIIEFPENNIRKEET